VFVSDNGNEHNVIYIRYVCYKQNDCLDSYFVAETNRFLYKCLSPSIDINVNDHHHSEK